MQLEAILQFFSNFIERELGIVYSNENYFQLQNRLSEISSLLGVASLEQLHAKAQQGISGQFKELLLDLATNNETSFFRDQKVFRALENEVLPNFTKTGQVLPRLNIWSAASSSGQEALSVAITLLEWCAGAGKNVDFNILGSDISDRILTKARQATYSQLEVQRGLPAPLMLKYFSKDPSDRWHANADLTRHIRYEKQNLTDIFNFEGPFDLVLCRNVLIYQNVERKAMIIKKINSVLAPGGYLILGAAESLLGISDDFTTVPVDGAILFKKKAA